MVSAYIGKDKYRTRIELGNHSLIADEPTSLGGQDKGPDPFALLLASLGACVAMTLRMYADRKKWSLDGVIVELSLTREDNRSVIHRRITSQGDLDETQTARLIAIASKCPVSKVITGEVAIEPLPA